MDKIPFTWTVSMLKARCPTGSSAA